MNRDALAGLLSALLLLSGCSLLIVTACLPHHPVAPLLAFVGIALGLRGLWPPLPPPGQDSNLSDTQASVATEEVHRRGWGPSEMKSRIVLTDDCARASSVRQPLAEGGWPMLQSVIRMNSRAQQFWKLAFLFAKKSPWVQFVELRKEGNGFTLSFRAHPGAIQVNSSFAEFRFGRTFFQVEVGGISSIFTWSLTAGSHRTEQQLEELLSRTASASATRGPVHAGREILLSRLNLVGLCAARLGEKVQPQPDGTWCVGRVWFGVDGIVRGAGGTMLDTQGDAFRALDDAGRLAAISRLAQGENTPGVPPVRIASYDRVVRQVLFTPLGDEALLVTKEGDLLRWAFRTGDEPVPLDTARVSKTHSVAFWWSDRATWLVTTEGHALRWPHLDRSAAIPSIGTDPTDPRAARLIGTRDFFAWTLSSELPGKGYGDIISYIDGPPPADPRDFKDRLTSARTFRAEGGDHATQLSIDRLGRRLAVSTPSPLVNLLDCNSGSSWTTNTGGTGGHPDGVALHPDAPIAALCSRHVDLIDIENDRLIASFVPGSNERCMGCFLPDGRRLLVVHGVTPYVVDLLTWAVHRIALDAAPGAKIAKTTALALSQDGKLVALGGVGVSIISTAALESLAARSPVECYLMAPPSQFTK